MTEALIQRAVDTTETDIALRPISAPALFERITGHRAEEHEPHSHSWRPSIVRGLNDQVCRTCLIYKSLWEEYVQLLKAPKAQERPSKTPKQTFDEAMLNLNQMLPGNQYGLRHTITEYQEARRRAAESLPPELAERLLTLMPAAPEGPWSNYAGD